MLHFQRVKVETLVPGRAQHAEGLLCSHQVIGVSNSLIRIEALSKSGQSIKSLDIGKGHETFYAVF